MPQEKKPKVIVHTIKSAMEEESKQNYKQHHGMGCDVIILIRTILNLNRFAIIEMC